MYVSNYRYMCTVKAFPHADYRIKNSEKVFSNCVLFENFTFVNLITKRNFFLFIYFFFIFFFLHKFVPEIVMDEG